MMSPLAFPRRVGPKWKQVHKELTARGAQFSYQTLTRFVRRNRFGNAKSNVTRSTVDAQQWLAEIIHGARSLDRGHQFERPPYLTRHGQKRAATGPKEGAHDSRKETRHSECDHIRHPSFLPKNHKTLFHDLLQGRTVHAFRLERTTRKDADRGSRKDKAHL